MRWLQYIDGGRFTRSADLTRRIAKQSTLASVIPAKAGIHTSAWLLTRCFLTSVH